MDSLDHVLPAYDGAPEEDSFADRFLLAACEAYTTAETDRERSLALSLVRAAVARADRDPARQ